MLALFEKEFKSFFLSLTGYVFIGFFLFMFGLYFSILSLFSQNADYSIVLGSLIIVLIFSVPILTMRLLSEERKNKTDQLLLTTPTKIHSIVIGKFLSAVLLLLLALLITGIHPFLLSTLGTIPVGKIVTSYIGYFLLGTTLIAIGVFISSLCENQIVAAIATIATYLFIMLIDSVAMVIPSYREVSLLFVGLIIIALGVIIYFSIRNIIISVSLSIISLGITGLLFFLQPTWFDGLPTKSLQWLSIFQRYEIFSTGLLDINSIIYYLSFTFLFIFLTVQVLDRRSWN